MNKIDDKIVAGVVRQEEKDRRALAIKSSKIIEQMSEEERLSALAALLDWRRDDGKILAFRGRMGPSPSYVSSVPLSWVASHVKFAGVLPVLASITDSRSKAVNIKKIPRYAADADHIMQRRPDWTRQMPMSVYLAAWERRKFPPLLVVGYQEWVNDKESKNWRNNQATCESVVTRPLGHDMCELTVDENTTFYALDGQHRLMAILGLQTLIDEKNLPKYDADKNRKKKGDVVISQIAQAIHRQGGKKLNDNAVLKKLKEIMGEESVGIEIIPAAVKGEKHEEAKFRLRSVFVDVNENAKKPTTGESILLDERNGFRVVARRVMVNNRLLHGRVYWKMRNLPKTSNDYTTLATVADIAESYLGHIEFSDWKNMLIPSNKQSGHVRPMYEVVIRAGEEMLDQYFTALESLPSHARMINEKDFPPSYFRSKDDHILFRPIAQMALAEACAIMRWEHGETLNAIVSELTLQENSGQLKLQKHEAPWCGVIWDPRKEVMLKTVGARALCMRLFLYLLGGDVDENKLQKDFAESRETYGENPILPDRWR